MILSTALCRPTSSAVSTIVPSVVHSAAACRPPVAAKVSCRGASRAGSAWMASASTVPASAIGGAVRRVEAEIRTPAHAARRGGRDLPARVALRGHHRRPTGGEHDVDHVGGRIEVHADDVGERRHEAFGEEEAGGELAVGAGRPHRHAERLAVQADLERGLDGHVVARGLAGPAVADAHHRDPPHPLASGHRRQDNIGSSMALFGLGRQKPHHYREMVRIVWENRDQLPFAWRILTRGVCDGCALGTTGVRDWTLPGTHLCMVRLELMRLNTAPALDPALLGDVSTLAGRSSAALRALGRLPEPMLRRRGERGFRVVTWDEALTVAAEGVRTTHPRRLAFYLTSRGITNEVYYAAQKAARFFGTNHVDNAARLCHAASTVAMKATLGHGASTCSYADWLDADLIVLFGSNVANNQPVTTKYLHEAKARGAQVAVVNPYREPGLARYWIPSIAAQRDRRHEDRRPLDRRAHRRRPRLARRVAESACTTFGGVDRAFVDANTSGAPDALAYADGDDLGHDRARVRRRAARRRGVRAAAPGAAEDRVRLVDGPDAACPRRRYREGVGQPRSRARPDGAARQRPRADPRPLGRAGRRRSRVRPGRARGNARPLGRRVGLRDTRSAGLDRDRGHRRQAPLATSTHSGWSAATCSRRCPTRRKRARALARPRLRIHHDIVLSTSMLVEGAGDVLLLPATTRYESPGGGTETSTERRIIFSPEIPGRRIGSAKPEWWVFREVMTRAHPERAHLVGLEDAAAIRREIDRAVPLYAGIGGLSRQGDVVQWGGRRLYADGRFATADGRARFAPVALRSRDACLPIASSSRRGAASSSTRWCSAPSIR